MLSSSLSPISPFFYIFLSFSFIYPLLLHFTLLFPFSSSFLPLSLQLFPSPLLCPILPILTYSFWILSFHPPGLYFSGFGIFHSKCYFILEGINQRIRKGRGNTLRLIFSCLPSGVRCIHSEFYTNNQNLSSLLLYYLHK